MSQQVSTMCYLCGSNDAASVPGRVRDKPEIPIYRCTACGLVYLGNFDHVHENYYNEDYTNENHSAQDWRAYLNDCRWDDERRVEQLVPLIANRRYMDIGCGGGGVLLMARLYARQVAGVEPQQRWRQLLMNEGISVAASLDEIPSASQDVVSLFHVLEHVPDPVPFLKKVVSKVASGGRIMIEVPNADDALLTLYKSRAFSEFTYWSPHLFLYNQTTLPMLLEKAGLKRSAFVVQQYQRYSLSNHLMWLAEGKPGGHMKWSFLDSPLLKAEYASQLAKLGRCDTLIATLEIG